jgi:hypothetical protein
MILTCTARGSSHVPPDPRPSVTLVTRNHDLDLHGFADAIYIVAWVFDSWNQTLCLLYRPDSAVVKPSESLVRYKDGG